MTGFEIFKAQDFILSLSPDKYWETSEIYELGETEGFNQVTIKRALSCLVQVGKIERIKRGVYKIIASGQWVTRISPIPDPNDPNSMGMNIPDYL